MVDGFTLARVVVSTRERVLVAELMSVLKGIVDGSPAVSNEVKTVCILSLASGYREKVVI